MIYKEPCFDRGLRPMTRKFSFYHQYYVERTRDGAQIIVFVSFLPSLTFCSVTGLWSVAGYCIGETDQ